MVGDLLIGKESLPDSTNQKLKRVRELLAPRLDKLASPRVHVGELILSFSLPPSLSLSFSSLSLFLSLSLSFSSLSLSLPPSLSPFPPSLSLLSLHMHFFIYLLNLLFIQETRLLMIMTMSQMFPPTHPVKFPLEELHPWLFTKPLYLQ